MIYKLTTLIHWRTFFFQVKQIMMRMMRLVHNRFVDSSGLYLCVHVDLSDEYSCKLKNRFLEDLSAQTIWPCYYGNRSAAKVKSNLFAPRISTVRYLLPYALAPAAVIAVISL